MINPSNCNNKWCTNHGTFPASGDSSGCSTYKDMEKQLLENGGITGRGVTPCPFGTLQSYNWGNDKVANTKLNPSNINNDISNAMIFDPTLPGYVPPTGQLRPLFRIGNEWRN